MDEMEEDSRYLTNYGRNQGYGSSQRPKVSGPHSQQVADNYADEDEDEADEDEEQQEPDAGGTETNGVNGGNNTDEDDDGENNTKNEDLDLHRHPKKRKLKSLLSSFQFAPREPSPPPPPPTKPTVGGRNTLTDWTEHETFVLLDTWGERFLQRGRKSLRSEEWQEVAEKVSHDSKTERSDTKCRNRLDTLKKKYKKEKSLLQSNKWSSSKWVYFKKMDMLMSSSTPPAQQIGLSCGVDSGEFVFTNPTVYLDRANGLDEMRDSPGNTDSQEGEGNEESKRSKLKGGWLKLLADSINKFSEVYEKIENGKRKQMAELEKMRMDFYKELEVEKREILDRARDEIAKIRQEENDSAENMSG